MSRNEIIEMVANTNAEALSSKYKGSALREMYVELTGEDVFAKSAKKSTIADAIVANVRAIQRGRAFRQYA